MIGHRDGYCLARNNYRLYHDPRRNRFVFLPHGMDQLFGKADATWRPIMSGLVARAIMESPQGRRDYRVRFEQLLRTNFMVADLDRQVDEAVARLRPSLDSGEGRSLLAAAEDLKERIEARRADLTSQLAQAGLQPLRFSDGVAGLSGWQAVDAPSGGRIDKAASPDGRDSLRILAGPTTAASWRTTVLLRTGHYRFEGRAMTRGVKPLPFGRNRGAGLRITGVNHPQPFDLVGDTAWTEMSAGFSVAAAEEEVELVCELRASAGEAWFDTPSLRLVRLP
jgi:hypothetical protein